MTVCSRLTATFPPDPAAQRRPCRCSACRAHVFVPPRLVWLRVPPSDSQGRSWRSEGPSRAQRLQGKGHSLHVCLDLR